MTNKPMLSVEREFQEVIYDLLASPQHHTRPEYIAAYEKLRGLLDKPATERKPFAWYRVPKDFPLQGAYLPYIEGKSERDIQNSLEAEFGFDVKRLYDDPDAQHQGEGFTYSSKQATNCAGCGVRKHTPLRVDDMGGYVCLTCIDNRLGELLEPERHQCEPVAYRWCVKGRGEWTASVCKVEFDARANDERFVAQALYAEPPAKRQGEPVGEVVHVSEDQMRIGLYDEYSLKVGDLVYAEQPAPVADHTQCEECKGWGYHENHYEGGGTECGECGGSGNASVELVMSERKCPSEYRDSSYTQTCMAGEYNRALDDVARLNGVKK